MAPATQERGESKASRNPKVLSVSLCLRVLVVLVPQP
jgi:hypothetical protein